MKMSKIAVLFITLALASQAHAQEEKLSEKYDKKNYSLTTKTLKHGNSTIKITQAKLKSNNAPSDANLPGCKAELTVTSADSKASKFFDKNDLEANGGGYGLFTPKKQPLKDWLIVTKLGNYDGRLFLISKDGKLFEYPGGEFVLSPDSKYLFAQHEVDDDAGEITVVNLSTGNSNTPVSLGALEANVEKWYTDGKNVFYTMRTDDIPTEHVADEKGMLHEKEPDNNFIYKYDYVKSAFAKETIDRKSIAKLKVIKPYLVPEKSERLRHLMQPPVEIARKKNLQNCLSYIHSAGFDNNPRFYYLLAVYRNAGRGFLS